MGVQRPRLSNPDQNAMQNLYMTRADKEKPCKTSTGHLCRRAEVTFEQEQKGSKVIQTAEARDMVAQLILHEIFMDTLFVRRSSGSWNFPFFSTLKFQYKSNRKEAL